MWTARVGRVTAMKCHARVYVRVETGVCALLTRPGSLNHNPYLIPRGPHPRLGPFNDVLSEFITYSFFDLERCVSRWSSWRASDGWGTKRHERDEERRQLLRFNKQHDRSDHALNLHSFLERGDPASRALRFRTPLCLSCKKRSGFLYGTQHDLVYYTPCSDGS